MKYIRINIIVVFILASCCYATIPDKKMVIWYKQPAKQWVEALPVGNGRLGAMVYSDLCCETIQLNENTVWAGEPNRNDNPDAKEALPEIRKLIFEGKYKEAQGLVNQKFVSKTSQGIPYQTVGNLKLTFHRHEKYTNYFRELDLRNAVVTSHYKSNGINYKSETFASYPHQGIITCVSADHEGVKGNENFEVKVKIVTMGGTAITNKTANDVNNTDEAAIYKTIATNFNNYNNLSANADELATIYLQNALKKDYDQLLKDHITNYQMKHI
jgi:alpha-L-fucosidase 2